MLLSVSPGGSGCARCCQVSSSVFLFIVYLPRTRMIAGAGRTWTIGKPLSRIHQETDKAFLILFILHSSLLSALLRYLTTALLVRHRQCRLPSNDHHAALYVPRTTHRHAALRHPHIRNIHPDSPSILLRASSSSLAGPIHLWQTPGVVGQRLSRLCTLVRIPFSSKEAKG
jgi:hypothetical protein